jgi:hypothetical protein
VEDIKGPQSTCGSQPADNTHVDHTTVNLQFTTIHLNHCS